MSELCEHSHPCVIAGIATCPDCGEELTIEECERIKVSPTVMSKIQEFTAVPDTGKKLEETGIYKEVEKYGFDKRVVEVANDIFLKVTRDKQTVRSRHRQGLIVACIFNAFQEIGEPRDCETITSVMGIKQNSIVLNGLKQVMISGRFKRSPGYKPITVETFIERILTELKATKEDKEYVKTFYTTKIKGNSTIMDRAKPQSVAAAVVYYWLTKECNHSMTPQEYVKVAKISPLTVSRIMTEINVIVHAPKAIADS